MQERTEKRCSLCGATKPILQFYVFRSMGRPHSWCKDCCRETSRKNTTECDPQTKERRRLKSREYAKKYRAANPEKLRAKWRAERQRDPEGARRRTREWMDRNHDHMLFRGVAGRARRAGLAVTIDRHWIRRRLEAGICELSGMAFSAEGKHVGRCSPFAASIDRIDSELGYTPDNCRMILWALNMGLSEWGEAIYLKIAQAVFARKHRVD